MIPLPFFIKRRAAIIENGDSLFIGSRFSSTPRGFGA